MVTLLLLTLVAVLAAGHLHHSANNEPIYRPGFQFNYSYESQTLTGIRSASNQLAGIKINCECILQFQHDGAVILQLDNIRVLQVNGPVQTSEITEIIPEAEATKLSGQYDELFVDQLKKPVKFRYEEGEVGDIVATRTDPYWSVNIKKGVLSLLQMNLKQKNAIHGSEQPDSNKSKSKIFESLFRPLMHRKDRRAQFDNIYKVMESDVTGQCETKYAIHADTSTSHSSVSEMIVTKVKNYDNCVSNVSYAQGLFAGFSHHLSDQKIMQTSVEADYILSGDRHEFLINEAKLEAKYIFQPYGHEGGHISTHIVQQLILRGSEQFNTPIVLESTQDKTGLAMDIPNSAVGHDFSADRAKPDEFQYKHLIDDSLNRILSSLYPSMLENSTKEVVNLHLVLRDVPQKQLKSIMKHYISDEKTEHGTKKRDMLLDTLPTLPNPATVKVMSELIREGSIQGLRALVSINVMSLTIKPTPDVAKTLMNLYNEASSLERDTPHLRQTVLLAVGTVCNKMINNMRRGSKPHSEVVAVIENISGELQRLFGESRSEEDKIRVVKAMGNMGAKELIEPLKNIIEDRREPKQTRMFAIYALRKLIVLDDKQLSQLLLSTFLDTKEDQKIRLAAFVVLRTGRPSKTTLQLIARSLNQEPSTQVKSFVYSNFVNMATSTSSSAELQKTSNQVREILKTVRAIPVSIVDSKSRLVHFLADKLNLGGALSLSTIKSKLSALPETIQSTLNGNIFGKYLHLAEAGIEGTGLETILRRLVGPHGLISDIMKGKAILHGILKPLDSPDMGSIGEYIREIMSRVVIEPRGDEQLRGYSYVELLGQELQYRYFDRASVERALKEMSHRASQIVNKLTTDGIKLDVLHTFSSISNMISIATPMGLPLSLNLSGVAIYSLNGHIKVRNMPRWMSLRQPSNMEKMDVEFDIKPRVNLKLYGGMGVDSRWVLTGCSVIANVKIDTPKKFTISVDPMDYKISMKYEIPRQELLKIDSKPSTFIKHIPMQKEKLPFVHTDRRELQNSESTKEIVRQKHLQCETVGIDVLATMNWQKCVTTWCPYQPLSGRQGLSVVLAPTGTRFPEFYIQVKSVNGNRWHGTWNYAPENVTFYQKNVDLFEHVHPHTSLSEHRRAEVLIDIGTTGLSTKTNEHLIETKLTWLTEEHFVRNQFNLQIQTEPLRSLPPFKLNADVLIVRPTSIFVESEANCPEETFATLNVSWGKHSFDEGRILTKVSRIDRTMWHNVLHQQGIDESAEESTNTPPIYSYKIDTEWSDKGRSPAVYIGKFCKKWTPYLWPHLSTTVPDHSVPNKIIVLTQFIPRRRKFSLVVSTPQKTAYMIGAPIPAAMSWPFWNPKLHDRYFPTHLTTDTNNTVDYEYRQPKHGPSLIGVCKINEDHLTTFDGITMWLPVTESASYRSRCELLLAHDCSDRALFSVIGANNRDNWRLKVFVPLYRFEVISSKLHNNIVLKVNGVEAQARQSEPIYLHQTHDNTSSAILYTIDLHSGEIELKCHELGMNIAIKNNNTISIKLSPLSMLQGHMCGLCGDYNYDKSDEFFSHRRRSFSTPFEYTIDHTVRSNICSRREIEGEFVRNEDKSCKKLTTMKIRHVIRGTEHVCFSKTPITSCKESCITEHSTTKSIAFACLPAEDHRTEELIDKVHQRLIVEEVSGLPTTLEENVHVALDCASEN